MSKLVGRQLAFVQAYVADPDLNATRAMLAAGYSPNNVGPAATRMMLNPKVREEIQRIMKGRAKRKNISADKVLEMWWEIATGDRTDFVNIAHVNCRYCHGDGHRYQYKHSEFMELLEHSKAKNGPPVKGGTGFNEQADPNPDCPNCFGQGVQRLLNVDTRHLPDAAKRLITKIKPSKEGLEVTFRDPDKALESVARHLGMFVEKIDINVKHGLAERMAKARARVTAAAREKTDE